jgi:hypothetical protein
MSIKKLPPELISLVHHVELNKAGWWDRGLEQLLIASLWISGELLSTAELLSSLKRNFQVQIDEEKASRFLARLCSKGTLVCMPDQKFRISEAFLRQYQGAIKEAEAIETSVEGTFIALLKKHCPMLDPKTTWRDFAERFLLPYIREIGANTYRLLSEGNLRVTPAKFERFVREYPPELRDSFRTATEEFLDPKNLDLRSYILRTLNGYFFIEASSLTADTIEALIKLSGSQITFNVFVDTNFLFAILGLVPFAEDAESLMSLIRRMKGGIRVTLYALPPTLDETKRKLIATKENLSGLRVVPNLAEAAVRMKLDGIHTRFFEESRKRGLCSAEDYFDPYITDLITIMRTKGVELYNEDVSHYKTKQSVLDDIVSQLKVEQIRYKHRAKNYERLEHDMILWHVTNDNRPVTIDSPLDAKYWFVTIDYRMLAFDKLKRSIRKRQGRDTVVPICLYPTALIQMLQFWVPRTPEFEEAILSSMRLPFLFQDFDPAAEKVTLDILSALGRYENVGDLPTETVSAILVNTALRNKMAATKEVEKKINLVREILIEEHTRTAKELEAKSAELAQREEQLKVESESRQATEAVLSSKALDVETLKADLAQLQETSRTEKEVLSGRIAELEGQVSQRKNEREQRRQRVIFTLKWLILTPIVGAVIGVAIVILTARISSLPALWVLVGTSSVLLLVWAVVLDLAGRRNPNVRDVRPFLIFQRFKAWLFGLLGLIIIGTLTNAIYDLLKKWWQ